MIFNSDEIFEIAIQIEKNGQDFYRKAAKIVTNAEISKFLISLAEMEVGHEELFIELKKSLSDYPKNEFPDMDDQLAQYLKSYANGKVFDPSSAPEEKINGEMSIQDIFDVAINFERESVIFFTLVKEMVPEAFGQDKIDVLIKEEITHIAILNNRLMEL